MRQYTNSQMQFLNKWFSGFKQRKFLFLLLEAHVNDSTVTFDSYAYMIEEEKWKCFQDIAKVFDHTY